MYQIRDTIAAVSSASGAPGSVYRTILRISGNDTRRIVEDVTSQKRLFEKRGVSTAPVIIDGNTVYTKIYQFPGPRSYTGEDIAEIHFFAAEPVVESIFQKIVTRCRLAGPGEFTLRAYLNGKIDLAQAEAVSQIVSSSNKFQLTAAEKLLAGKLCCSIGKIRGELLDIISLIEAGLDFSEEDIELVSSQDAAMTIKHISTQLLSILDSSLRYEELIDIPSVGLAGAANAGKSSLMNALIGKRRSIISGKSGTTRDVLSDVLEMDRSRCAIFDCAGLGKYQGSESVMDQLGQNAAKTALDSAQLVIFCIDITKDDYTEDLSILEQINSEDLIPVLTKSDQVPDEKIAKKTTELKKYFKTPVIVTSICKKETIDNLRTGIQQQLLSQTAGSETVDRIAINQRHRTAVNDAIGNLSEAKAQVLEGNDEVAAMLLRTGYNALAAIEREDIGEAILDRIFSSFCIGK